MRGAQPGQMVFSFSGPWPWQGPPRATLQQRSAANEPRPRARAVQGRLSSSLRLQCTALAKGHQRLRPLLQPGRLELLGLSTASAVVLVEAGSRRQRHVSTSHLASPTASHYRAGGHPRAARPAYL